MIPINLGCNKIVPDARIPILGSRQSACFDIHVCFHKDQVKINGNDSMDVQIDEDGNKFVHLYPGSVALIPTGLRFVIPHGYQMKIIPRSGHAWKHKITILNSPGTIDSDYREETFVMVYNASASNCFKISDFMKIAQAELMENLTPDIRFYEATEEHVQSRRTNRNGGFGSTGE